MVLKHHSPFFVPATYRYGEMGVCRAIGGWGAQ